MRNKVVTFLICIVLVVTPQVCWALACFPGAEGFGSTSAYAYEPGGRGVTQPTIYRVTNLNNSGTGSLRYGMETLSGPRIIIFEISGIITLSSLITSVDPYLIVAGETAPSPGITLKHYGINLENTHDVLISHLRIRLGAGYGGDGIGITGSSSSTETYNIYIDHCSMSWSNDECMSWYTSTIGSAHTGTMRLNIMSEGIEGHGYGGHLKGTNDGIQEIAYIGNVWMNLEFRGPLLDAGSEAVILNNVEYNFGSYYISLSDAGLHKRHKVSLIGSVAIDGPLSSRGYLLRSLSTYSIPADIYLEDNLCRNMSSYPDCYDDQAGTGTVDTPPLSFSPMTKRAASETIAWVKANAGARPADRDSVDNCLLAEIPDSHTTIGTEGDLVSDENDPDSCGPWDTTSGTTRTLTTPSNPHSVAASGYTNLEEWLHGYRAQVEQGNMQSLPPSPPGNLRLVQQ